MGQMNRVRWRQAFKKINLTKIQQQNNRPVSTDYLRDEGSFPSDSDNEQEYCPEIGLFNCFSWFYNRLAEIFYC